MKIINSIGKAFQCVSFISILLFAVCADSIMASGKFLTVALIWVGSAASILFIGRWLDELA